MAEPKNNAYETHSKKTIQKNISATKHAHSEPNWFAMSYEYAAINTLAAILQPTVLNRKFIYLQTQKIK